MSEPHLLPLLGEPPQERRDAARNRERLLVAAQELIDHCGIEAVTMDAVAAKAGVGKGTVFRRFTSREGLMGAVLNFSETAWQASIISGPPPLGPGAPPMQRLMAFGRSRLESTLVHAELIRAAGRVRPAAGRTPRTRSPRCTCATCWRSRRRRRPAAAGHRPAGPDGDADPAPAGRGRRVPGRARLPRLGGPRPPDHRQT